LAYSIGQAVANILTELGGVPLDSNPLNLIVQGFEHGQISVRYCDIEELRTTPEAISKEIELIAEPLGQYASEFKRGIFEHYQGHLWAP